MTETDASAAPDVLRCAECGTALTHDQRYCLACGARRRRMPGAVARLHTGFPAASKASRAIFAPLGEYLPGWAATPRAAAVAVLGMLGFGVIVGSTVGAGTAGVLRPAIILVMGSSAHRGASTSGGYVGSGGGGSGSRPRTVIETITETSPSRASSTSGSQPTTSATTSPTTSTPTTSTTALPPIKHVFLIMLSDQGYSQTFGSTNPYFGKALPKQGEVVPSYYGTTQGELANEIALLSGQGPTPQTASDCPTYSPFTETGSARYGQVLGSGCVYPAGVKTLAEQLIARNRGGWKAYIQGLSEPQRSSTTTSDQQGTSPSPCTHPSLGATDDDNVPTEQEPYVTWRNPFVYFRQTVDGSSCVDLDVSLTELGKDLRHKRTTPALAYISPDPCDDGSGQPCEAGAVAGLGPAQKFLQTVLQEIERSSAYKAGGLILVTFDQAPQTGQYADSSSCCDQPTFPNIPAGSTTSTGLTTTPTTTTATTTGTTTTATTTGTTTTTATTGTTGTGTTGTGTGKTTTGTEVGSSPGGGQVGLLLISKYVKPGSTDLIDYFNHFSLLASLERIFRLPRLGYARDPALPTFTASLFNASS